MQAERVEKIKQLLRLRQADLTVITDKINKNQNISAILRSCDAFGIHQIHMVKPDGNFNLHHRTAGGAGQWVRQTLHNSSESALQLCKKQGLKIYAAHLSHTATSYKDIDYTQPCAIVTGAEKEGISEVTKQHADGFITIPMQGMVESFNVSVATAIILNEAHQQRLNKGMYNGKQTISQAEFDYILFRNCHPRLAKYCDRHELAYPEIDEFGHLVKPNDWYEKIKKLI